MKKQDFGLRKTSFSDILKEVFQWGIRGGCREKLNKCERYLIPLDQGVDGIENEKVYIASYVRNDGHFDGGLRQNT